MLSRYHSLSFEIADFTMSVWDLIKITFFTGGVSLGTRLAGITYLLIHYLFISEYSLLGGIIDVAKPSFRKFIPFSWGLRFMFFRNRLHEDWHSRFYWGTICYLLGNWWFVMYSSFVYINEKLNQRYADRVNAQNLEATVRRMRSEGYTDTDIDWRFNNPLGLQYRVPTLDVADDMLHVFELTFAGNIEQHRAFEYGIVLICLMRFFHGCSSWDEINSHQATIWLHHFAIHRHFFKPVMKDLKKTWPAWRVRRRMTAVMEASSFLASLRKPEEVYEVHSKPENMTDKEVRHDRFERKKRDSNRRSKKETRVRKHRAIARIVAASRKKEPLDMTPHAGTQESVMQYMEDFNRYVSSYSGTEFDDVIRHAENICVLSYQMYRATAFDDIILAIISYMKCYIKGSVSSIVTALLEGVFDGEDHEPHALTGRDLLDNWELLKTNTVFSKISYLLAAAMTSSMCTVKDISFDIAGLKLVSLEAMKGQVKAVDLVDALVQTYVWVTETGWWCIKEKSLAPILYQDQRIRDYTITCNDVIAYASTAMAGNIDDSPVNWTLEEYERKLDSVLKTTSSLQKVTNSGAVREMFQKKYSILVEIKMDLINKRKNTNFRFAPIGFCVFGESSIGKSDIATLTMKTSLTAMGFSSAQEGLVTLNETDKYESTYTSDVVGVYIDDANNANSKFVETSPTQKYIQFFNNVAAQAVKAELNEKGCVFINFKCGVLTTNTKTLGAQQYSNYPVAVLRRFYHVTAKVKGPYCTPNGKSLNTDHPDIVNATPGEYKDVWIFSIERVVPDGTKIGRFEPITLPIGKDGADVVCLCLNLRLYLKAVAYLSKYHKIKQDKQVARSEMLEKNSVCVECCSLPQFCNCDKENEPHSLIQRSVNYILWMAFKDFLRTWIMRFSPFVGSLLYATGLHIMPIRELQAQFDAHLEHGVPWALSYAPSWFYGSPFCHRIINLYVDHFTCVNIYNLNKNFKRNWWWIMLLSFWKYGFLGLFAYLFFAYAFSVVIETLMIEERERFREAMEQRRDATIVDYGRMLRDNWRTAGAVTLVSFLGVRQMLLGWNALRKDVHGLTDPSDNDAAPAWYANVMGWFPSKIKCAHTGATSVQIQKKIEKNLAWASFELKNGKKNCCNAFFPRKSIMMIPKHVFYPDSDMNGLGETILKVTITRHPSSGGKFKVTLNRNMVYMSPENDLAICYIPNCPDLPTVLQWFPTGMPSGKSLAMMVSCDMLGGKSHGSIEVLFQSVRHKFMTMRGGSYVSRLSRVGNCMSPIVSEGKNPCIVGFHIGGNSATNEGICMTVLHSEIDAAIDFFDKCGDYVSAEATEIPERQMDIPLLKSNSVHPKAKYVASMDQNHFVDVIGSTQLRSEQRSQVVESMLSGDVADVTGVESDVGPPEMVPNYEPFNVNLGKFSHPSEDFDPALLKRAADDYEGPLMEAMDVHCRTAKIRPLTLKEAIMGVPGVKYLDALPMNTGIGFPLRGKKNKQNSDGLGIHFRDVYCGGLLVDRVPQPHILEEIERLRDCYRRGIRGYPVTTATLKDEPVKIGKKKVRVFQAIPIGLSLLIRQFFLPLARFLHLHPLISSSAVGINAFSRSWQELIAFAGCHGVSEDKLLAWDFKDFDSAVCAAVTRKAWGITIRLAERAGYTQEALTIMKNMVADITHPLMDLNGTMLMPYAMNTSGHNLTVDINGIIHNLYVRMGFFSIYPERDNFREWVSLMTYGDDGIASSRPEVRGFNFSTFKEFLAKHGIVITLPSKTDEVTDFLTFEESDFLKRQSSYIPEIKCSIGKLAESSIFKSLHANVKSSVATPRQVAASCLETAMHEWFAYGREHYEMRRAQMQEVARRQDLPLSVLNYTFDERVEFWKEKYPVGVDSSQSVRDDDTAFWKDRYQKV